MAGGDGTRTMRAMIAVIDRDGSLCEALEAALGEEPPAPVIVHAEGAAEGRALITELARARGERCALILIDLALPARLGPALVEQARREPTLAGTRILAVGARPDDQPLRLAPDTDVLPPLRGYADFQRLATVVREALE